MEGFPVNIQTIFKILLMSTCSIIYLQTLAGGELESLDASIASMLDHPICHDVQPFADNIKIIITPNPQNDMLEHAYKLLIAANKPEIAMALLVSLQDVPALQDKISDLEVDAVSRISAAEAEATKASESKSAKSPIENSADTAPSAPPLPSTKSSQTLKTQKAPTAIKPPAVARPPSPVKPGADTELAPIIKEHSVDKSTLENNRIESIEDLEFLVLLIGMPTQFNTEAGITVNAQQMPALSQLEYRGKSADAVIKELADTPTSIYCGYYAGYNLWCIINNQPHDIMNRQLFADHFGPMLSIIKKSDFQEINKQLGFEMQEAAHKFPYDGLKGYEFEFLLSQEFKIEPFRYLNLHEAKGKILSASENQEAYEARAALLKAFREGPQNQEKMIPILFNIEADHWVAIKATQHEKTLSLEIYDSLNKRNWQDIDANPALNTEILRSLAIYLTTPGMD